MTDELCPTAAVFRGGNVSAISAYRTCVDRPYVQLEIGEAVEAKKRIVTIYEVAVGETVILLHPPYLKKAFQ